MRLFRMKHFLGFTLMVLGILITNFSCRNLLYDDEYAKIAVTTNKMTRVANIGPIYFEDVHMDEWDVLFIPDQTDYSNGFLLVQRNYQYTFWYITNDGVISEAYTQSLSSGNSFVRGMTVPNQPGYIRFVFSDGGAYQSYFFRHSNGSLIEHQTNPDLQFTMASYFESTYTGSNFSINGIFFSPIDDFTYYFLSSENTADQYYEIKGSDNTTLAETYDNWGITLNTTAAKISLGFEDHGYYPYVHNVRTHTSYFSQYDGNSNDYDVYTWNNTSYNSPQQIAGLTQKIDYVLSTNHLMSIDEDSISVFSETGEAEFEISLGALDFVYENTTGESSTEMVFSHVGLVPNHSDNRRDEVYIKVYTIPSNDFEKLGL